MGTYQMHNIKSVRLRNVLLEKKAHLYYLLNDKWLLFYAICRVKNEKNKNDLHKMIYYLKKNHRIF